MRLVINILNVLKYNLMFYYCCYMIILKNKCDKIYLKFIKLYWVMNKSLVYIIKMLLNDLVKVRMIKKIFEFFLFVIDIFNL